MQEEAEQIHSVLLVEEHLEVSESLEIPAEAAEEERKALFLNSWAQRGQILARRDAALWSISPCIIVL